MDNYFSRYTKAELLQILTNERRKFNRGIDYGSPAGHLEEIRQFIQLIEAAIAEKEIVPPSSLQAEH